MKKVAEYAEICGMIVVLFFAIYGVASMAERHLPPRVWEMLVDAFNRFFGGGR